MTYLSMKRLDLWLWTQGGEDINAPGDLTNDQLIQLTNDSGVNLTTDNP